MGKTAFITGITGQDGSYLSELLLEKGYTVIGLVSQKYNIGFQNIEHIRDQLIFEDGDLLDADSLKRVFETHNPDEVYNLAGITFVPTSWEKPTLTVDINTLGVSRILELIATDYRKTKFWQASSARIFGNAKQTPQNEETLIQPQEPYSVSKASAHMLVKVMREHFDIFACSGILYNHESERRGPEFVTRKITQHAAQIKHGITDTLELGDLDAKQDWGYAPDYVEAMWRMLQQDTPDDYVIASGEYHTVRSICEIAFDEVGLQYQDYVRVNESFIRKEKFTAPLGDTTKARNVLNWHPKVTFEEMIRKMVRFDLDLITNNSN